MMMICENNVMMADALRSGGYENYLTLLEAKVKEMEAVTPVKADPRELIRKK